MLKMGILFCSTFFWYSFEWLFFSKKYFEKKQITSKIKKNLLAPTKIYVNEILNLCKKNLINSAANITGGGIIENISQICS